MSVRAVITTRSGDGGVQAECEGFEERLALDSAVRVTSSSAWSITTSTRASAGTEPPARRRRRYSGMPPGVRNSSGHSSASRATSSRLAAWRGRARARRAARPTASRARRPPSPAPGGGRPPGQPAPARTCRCPTDQAPGRRGLAGPGSAGRPSGEAGRPDPRGRRTPARRTRRRRAGRGTVTGWIPPRRPLQAQSDEAGTDRVGGEIGRRQIHTLDVGDQFVRLHAVEETRQNRLSHPAGQRQLRAAPRGFVGRRRTNEDQGVTAVKVREQLLTPCDAGQGPSVGETSRKTES